VIVLDSCFVEIFYAFFSYEKCQCVNPHAWHTRTITIDNSAETIIAPLCQHNNRCFKAAERNLSTIPGERPKYCSHCTRQCSRRDFVVQTSSLTLLTRWSAPSIKRFVENSGVKLPDDWNNTWQTQMQENYVAVRIVLQDSVVENYTSSATMLVGDVLANVGGQAGLWIGISVLSIMELIEMLYRLFRLEFQRFVDKCCRRK
jgi:hypothetical protein